APRIQATPFYTSFLKIAEGCNRTCSFCIIPKIRGRQESRSIDSLVEEARRLAGNGVRELSLIAQDLTSYGSDRDDGASLTRLLEALLAVEGIAWFRARSASARTSTCRCSMAATACCAPCGSAAPARASACASSWRASASAC